MALLLSLLVAALVQSDQVHLKSGEVVTGRLTEYADHVIVLAEGGQPRQIKLKEIDRITYERDCIQFPGVERYEHPGFTDYDTIVRVAGGRVILTSKKPDPPMILIDPTGARPPAEIALKRPIGKMVIEGTWLYFLDLETVTDDKQMLRVGDFEEPKEVHTLTFHAIDLVEMKEAWSRSFDNNDRTDLLWEFLPGGIRMVRRNEDFLLVVSKRGHPVSRTRQVDQAKWEEYATVYSIPRDPNRTPKKPWDSEAIPESGPILESEGYLIWQERETTLPVRLFNIRKKRVVGVLEKKPPEQLLGATGKYFYTKGSKYMAAYFIKSRKPAKGFPISTGNGIVEQLTDEFIGVRRIDLKPPTLVYYDPAKGTERFRIQYGARDGLTLLGRHRKYFLFTDTRSRLTAWNVLTGKLAWRKDDFGTVGALKVNRIGNTLYVLQADQLHALDLHTAEMYWSIPVKGMREMHEASGTLVGSYLWSLQFVRETRLPPGSIVFAKNGIPPKVALQQPWFTPPHVEGNIFFSIDAVGILRGYDAEKLRWDAGVKVLDNPAVARPTRHGDLLLAADASGVTIFDLKAGKAVKRYNARYDDVERPFTLHEDTLYLGEARHVTAYDLKARRELWRVPLSGSITAPCRLADRLAALSPTELVFLNPETGKSEAAYRLAPRTSYRSVRSDPQGRLVLVNRGFGLAQRHKRLKRDAWTFAARAEITSETRLVPGSLLFSGDRYIYATAAGEVVALNGGDGTRLWSTPTPKMTSSLLKHGANVYFADRARGLRALKIADGKDAFEPVAVPNAETFSALIWNDRVWFWSTEGYLVPAPPH